jgi:hypothetical protein
MSLTENKNTILLALSAFAFVFSMASDLFLDSKNKALLRTNTQGIEYKILKETWLNKEYSKNYIDSLTAEMGKGYFSAVVTKKELKGDIYSVGLMILNSDEFDAIIRRILNSNLKINKLDIISNDVGYLIDLEITL